MFDFFECVLIGDEKFIFLVLDGVAFAFEFVELIL